MRRVTGVEVRRPRWAEREIERAAVTKNPVADYVYNASENIVLLECGHKKADPLYLYSNETAVHIKLLAQLISPDTKRRCRCYECK